MVLNLIRLLREKEEYRQGDCEKQKIGAREEAKDDQLIIGKKEFLFHSVTAIRRNTQQISQQNILVVKSITSLTQPRVVTYGPSLSWSVGSRTASIGWFGRCSWPAPLLFPTVTLATGTGDIVRHHIILHRIVN